MALMKKLFLSCVALIAVTACATVQTENKDSEKQQKPACGCAKRVKRNVKPEPAQYEAYAQKGTSEISGRLCGTDVNGKNKICLRKQMVVLNPVTDYSTEWYVRYWTNNEPLEKTHEIAKKYNKIVYTGKRGEFSFKELPAGEYYIGGAFCPGNIKFKTKQAEYKYSRYGVKVTVGEGETKRVVLEKVF